MCLFWRSAEFLFVFRPVFSPVINWMMPEFGMNIKDLVLIYDHCMKNSVTFFKWQLTATHQSQKWHSVPFVDLVATWCGNSFCLVFFFFFNVWQCCRSTGLFFCDIFLIHSSNLWGKKNIICSLIRKLVFKPAQLKQSRTCLRTVLSMSNFGAI